MYLSFPAALAPFLVDWGTACEAEAEKACYFVLSTSTGGLIPGHCS